MLRSFFCLFIITGLSTLKPFGYMTDSDIQKRALFSDFLTYDVINRFDSAHFLITWADNHEASTRSSNMIFLTKNDGTITIEPLITIKSAPLCIALPVNIFKKLLAQVEDYYVSKSDRLSLFWGSNNNITLRWPPTHISQETLRLSTHGNYFLESQPLNNKTKIIVTLINTIKNILINKDTTHLNDLNSLQHAVLEELTLEDISLELDGKNAYLRTATDCFILQQDFFLLMINRIRRIYHAQPLQMYVRWYPEGYCSLHW